MTNNLDEEDIMECDCYMIICVAKNGGFFTDRVYRDKALAEKRITYLNALSKERGQWFSSISELGK